MPLNILLYGIVDPQIARGRSLADLAAAAAKGGATLIQYRAKDASTRDMVREAKAIHAALAGTNVPLLINDRLDVALAAGAEGVHLGADDMALSDARRLLGEAAIIGATLKHESELPYLASVRIDYACIGGVFATQHKDNADAPLGLGGYRSLREAARAELGDLPIGAIAGITAGNAASVMAAGADGIAVIGAMFGGDDVEGATQKLRAVLNR
jgi:thiamine-phosphate pyrophosphorylase